MEKLSGYTGFYPEMESPLAELDWISEDDEILFYQDLEESSEVDLTDELLDKSFGGELKLSQFLAVLPMMEKQAAITTQADRARMRTYRLTHKTQLQRKAKIRKMKQRSGMQRKKQRVGSAAGGFSFIETPSSGPKIKTSVSSTSDTTSRVSLPKFNVIVSSSLKRSVLRSK